MDDYRLAVRFDDGTEGEVASYRLFGPVFEPLRDPVVFAQVFVDEYGAIAWPNGADLGRMHSTTNSGTRRTPSPINRETQQH